MRNFLDDWGIILVPIIFIAILIMLFVGSTYFVNKKICNSLEQTTGKETQFNFWGGGETSCLIKLDNGFTPVSNWLNNSGN